MLHDAEHEWVVECYYDRLRQFATIGGFQSQVSGCSYFTTSSSIDSVDFEHDTNAIDNNAAKSNVAR